MRKINEPINRSCDNCRDFYTCDNMGTYEECLPSFKFYVPKWIEDIDISTSEDLELICRIAEAAGNLTEEKIKELLSRKDVDEDYADTYFFPMAPYGTIREAVAYALSNAKEQGIRKLYMLIIG